MADETTATTVTSTATSSTGHEKMDIELTCTTCGITFESKDAKRIHMKCDWHVYNLKRRIASLSPITLTIYEEKVANPIDASSSDESAPTTSSLLQSGRRKVKRKAKRDHHRHEEEAERSGTSLRETSLSEPLVNPETVENDNKAIDARQCLFCSHEALTVDSNMAHMSQTHSFFLPDMDSLIDLESLLSYLAIIVRDFHECIYCGCVRSGHLAVQDHMRGKGHCNVIMDDERHALRDFYDFDQGVSGSGEESGLSEDEEEDEDEDEQEQEQEQGKTLTLHSNELRLPSGKVASHRSQARRAHIPTRKHAESSLATNALRDATDVPTTEADRAPTPAPKNAIVMRAGTSHSMLGVPEVQQRALLAVEQKMLKIEARMRNEYEAAVQRGGNRQKRFKVKSIGKKAGGLEKRCG